MKSYDVVIIGGGPGGYNAAIRAGQLGMSVACVEGRSTLGGTCLNVGCMPSKALLHASELFEAASGDEFAHLGIEVKPSLNLAQMMKQKDESVTGLTKGIEYLFRKNKVDWIKGWGRLGRRQGRRQGRGRQRNHLQAKDIVIATGSEPTPLPGVTIDNQRIIDSTGALSLPQVPKHLVVIGAGVIGLELGSVWRRLVRRSRSSSTSTASARAPMRKPPRPCRRPGQARHGLQAGQQGHPGHAIGRWRQPDPGTRRRRRRRNPASRLCTGGHRPSPVHPGPEPGERGPGDRQARHAGNDHHRSSVPGIWVIGDVTSGPMLAHKAEDEAVACIERIPASRTRSTTT
jgi:dihydrolipoamide dehydrogenase